MKAFGRITDDIVVEWTRRFAAWPSEQSTLMENDPAVRGFVTDCVQPLIESFGIGCRIDAAGNLIAVIGPSSAPIEIALIAYAMTHPRSTMRDPFAAELVETGGETSVRGRGVSEQKAALAAALAAFIDLASAGTLSRRAAFIQLTAGETGRHDAIAAALSALADRPRHAILAVGTDMRISLGNRGRLDIDVVIEGTAAHSSTPWEGRDVTAGIAAVLTAAQRLSGDRQGATELGPASLTCTAIRTWPEATHTIQSEAHMVFDRRLLPSENVDQVLEEITSLFQAVTPLAVRIAKGPYMLGAYVGRTSPFIERIEQALIGPSASRPDYYFSYSALDAGYLASQGIAAIMWGPGSPKQFHTDEESVRVADLLVMTRQYRAVLTAFVT
jgi:acetylornithine deacetylase/succinyl-diaminopimelate desuccinylase-like protein